MIKTKFGHCKKVNRENNKFSFVLKKYLAYPSTGSTFSWNQVRFASKKATGGNRNKKQAPGNHHGIKKNDGVYVFPGEVLVFKQSRLWFHPGLNVTYISVFGFSK